MEEPQSREYQFIDRLLFLWQKKTTVLRKKKNRMKAGMNENMLLIFWYKVWI